jgi:TetR/AcrR family transcriptional regulator, transcriptional repressor for nem operon
MSKRGRGSLREQSKSQTRQAIIEAAVACFSEAGLDSPSLDSICARAGCTRGAFYVHFKNRDALIAAAMAERRGAVLSTMLSGPPGSLSIPELLNQFGLAVESGAFPIAGAVRSGELLAACRRSRTVQKTQVRLLKETLQLLKQHAAAGRKSGTLRPDMQDTELATLLLVLEAGTELLLDFSVPLDFGAAARALARLVAPEQLR